MNVSKVHWNGHQMAAIDCETTGLDPAWHEICQIAIVPLTSTLEIRKEEGLTPFVVKIRPENPDAADPQAMSVNGYTVRDLLMTGVSREYAAEALQVWFDKLRLPFTPSGQRKRILPLGHNYDFDKSFIVQWLGQAMYDQFFDYEVRDTKRIVAYLNDRAAVRGEEIPFIHTGLGRVAHKFGIDNSMAHDALHDCIMTAAVYKRLLDYGV